KILVYAHMFRSRSMTGLASDAEFRDIGRITDNSILVPRLALRLFAWLGVVTKHAAFVPDAALVPEIVRVRRQERAVGMYPALLHDVVVALDELRPRLARHGAMICSMPAFVVRLMTLEAGVGRD